MSTGGAAPISVLRGVGEPEDADPEKRQQNEEPVAAILPETRVEDQDRHLPHDDLEAAALTKREIAEIKQLSTEQDGGIISDKPESLKHELRYSEHRQGNPKKSFSIQDYPLSKRIGKPTQKLRDNMDQQQKLLEDFWVIVKYADGLVTAAQDLDLKYARPWDRQNNPDPHQLQTCLKDLELSYDALRRSLIAVPQDVRRHMDLYKAELERLIGMTRDVPAVPDGGLERESNHSHQTTVTGLTAASTTSSKRALLAARAASLQIEIEAKKQEIMQKQELQRLENEEIERQAKHEAHLVAERARQDAEEKVRRAKMQAELESKRQDLEDQRIRTQLKKTEVELQTLEKRETENLTFPCINRPRHLLLKPETEKRMFTEPDQPRHSWEKVVEENLHISPIDQTRRSETENHRLSHIDNPRHVLEKTETQNLNLPHADHLALEKTEMKNLTYSRIDQPRRPGLNEAASPFVPGIYMSTPGIETLDTTNINSLLKTVTDSVSLSRLPIPEPPIFDGDPLQYPAWKASFATLIESRQIPPAERIHYMKQYLRGEAREPVEALFYLDTETAYENARSILEKRYGNAFIVSEAFRDKLESWPKVNNGDSKGLRKLSDFLRQLQTAMSHFADLQILNDCRENRKILRKLPDWLVRSWSRIVNDQKPYPNFKRFVDFVAKESDILCNPITSLKADKTETLKNGRKSTPNRSAAANTFLNDSASDNRSDASPHSGSSSTSRKDKTSSSNTTSKKVNEEPSHPCAFCEKPGHKIYDCYKFGNKTPLERRDYIRKKGLCLGCLKGGHLAKECKRRSICEKCKAKHPTCLHGDFEALNPKEPSKKETSTVHSTANHESQTLRCSMTVPVYLSSEEDSSTETLVYALLDTQSDTTFVTDETVTKLKAKVEPTRLKISTMSSSCVLDCGKLRGLQMRGINSNVRVSLPTTYTRDCIPMNRSHIPTPDVVDGWPHLSDLAGKISPLQNCDVGLLIGYNCPQALAPINVITGQNEEPFGIETSLGWSIVGLTTRQEEDDEHVTHRIMTKLVPEELSIDGRLAVTFIHQTKVHENPVICPSEIVKVLEADFQDRHQEKKMSQEDIKFLRIMRNNIRQTADGFYQSPLPFRDGQPELPDNLPAVRKRLEQLRKRMKSDPSYASDYRKFMDKMIAEGDAELVDETLTTGHSRWIIPHHGVYHKRKGKLRVVFDCAARYRGTCLNDHLLQGPDLMNTLLGCLLRFREGPIAVAGDIERMFYRFKVDPDDRNYLQFLWWDGDIDSDPKLYRMTVHLFGAVSSPGCANFTLKKLVSDYEQEFSKAVCQFIRDNFYVDDGLCSCSTVEEATLLIRGARELCQKANIRLHKFVSNSEAVMNDIPESERANTENVHTMEFPTLTMETILGIQWDIQSDQFRFRLTLDQKPMSRRGILSTVASVYDPLGCLAPFILLGKQILQEMCRTKCGWDEQLSEDLYPRWERWLSELPKLSQVRIPRCYIPEDFGEVSHLEVHHFSDASCKGYGQCSYLRMLNCQNEVHVCLLLGKSRVVPLKGATIPRLELAAAVVSVRTADIIKEELSHKTVEEYFWTDSKIVLGYIKNEGRRFHVFVANRISRIKDSSNEKQWHYIESKHNPADHASRGLYPEELMNSNWFRGPDFLWELDWSIENNDDFDIDPEDPELKKAVVNTCSETSTTQEPVLQRFEKFSSWSSVVTAVAVIQRFLQRKLDPLSCINRDKAELTILKLLQAEYFAEELKMLEDGNLPKKNRLHRLDPFLDKDGILRVGGRLQRSSLSYGVQHPVILPKSGHLVELIIRHCHEKVAHQGRGFTTNELRSRGYWILGSTKSISSVIYRCVTCRKLRGKTADQKMAELPTDRTEPTPPFTYIGIDCFGPFIVKEGRREIKRYGLIVTCMASRAIHIECLDDMTTDCFINALRCVIALRGPIKQIRCDQGSNFVGAKRIFEESLNEMENTALRQFLADNQCGFLMNTPHSSHMGGSWERHIRTIRSILAAVLEHHNSRLDTSTLRTFLYEVMAIINCRPLTAQNLNDPLGPEPLTPNHLITMKPKLILPPPGEFTKEHLYARQRWRRVQYLAEDFWNRWKKEYLLTQQKRCKWNKTRRNMVVGDLVLLRGEELYRGGWRLAKILETITDDDGLVRRVKLLIGDPNLSGMGRRVAKPSILDRPVHKLVLLVEN